MGGLRRLAEAEAEAAGAVVIVGAAAVDVGRKNKDTAE